MRGRASGAAAVPVVSRGGAAQNRAEDMTSAAVIVGIDTYDIQPLTSAVRDAEQVRDTLLELGLVENEAVTMLTAPEGVQNDRNSRRRFTWRRPSPWNQRGPQRGIDRSIPLRTSSSLKTTGISG
jgi:hypothetical protein